MDLFVINRYTGDETNETEVPNEDELRKKLLKKIKKRKHLSETHDEENNLENEFKHKKRKKLENSESNELENPEEEKIKKKKKKKIDDEEIQNNKEEDSNNVSPDENINPIKKHKKSKKEKSLNDKNKNDNTEEIENDNSLVKEDKENENENEQSHGGFTILGDVSMTKKEKVKRKLPNWLAHPSVVSVDLKNLNCTVDSIPQLDKIFVDKLKENNITHFFPVQTQIIPWLLKKANRPSMYWPNDICVSAPTGSGKTLAFVLPILQVLHKRIVPSIRALVVLPVQDLANQVFKVFETYSKPTNLKVLLLSTKRPFNEEQSLICKNDGMGNWKVKVDIIVTTPGRLVEHLNMTKGFCLDNLKYLVIDEADRVMEKMQNDWLYHLNKCLNSECTRSYQVPIISYNNMVNKKKPPNKLLFSATLSQDPEKLQQLGLFQPKLFTSIVKSKAGNDVAVDETKFIGKYTTPAELKEYYTIATKSNKPLIIHHLLKSKSWRNVLCFVNSAEATFRLSYVLRGLLKKKAKIGKLSASLSVRKRDMMLQKFLSGEINILVSSDALARGMDIPNVQYVISYDAPKYIKTYIHRIGRTGRAGKEGTSLTLLTSKETNHFQKMIETAGKSSVEEYKINPDELVPYEKAYEKVLSSLGTALEKQKQKMLNLAKKSNKLRILAAKGKFRKTTKKRRMKSTVRKKNKKKLK